MKEQDQIRFWAHMLDESRHTSYYEVYMQEHPEDRLPKLIDTLIGEFADSLKKDNINLQDCVVNGNVNSKIVEDMQKSIKHRYVWELIPAKTYAAIISRSTALMVRTKGQRMQEQDNDIQFDDVSRMVSRRTVEDCLDIICHNTNVLEANNSMLLDAYNGSPKYGHLFQKHGIIKMFRHDNWHNTDVEDYLIATQIYKAWASYAKGTSNEPYVCDSDNGPKQLKKVLNSVEYSADTLDLVVALNKSLDIVHFRSDLAAAFIQGGQQTCALVSNLPDKFVI